MNRAIGLMLKMLNCEVLAFQGVRAAVQTLLSGKSPDLLLLDINMPEVSGLDMLEFLRRRKEWKSLPVIMLSSEAAESLIDKTIEMGADSYLMKPVTIQELERTMADVMQKRVSIK
jgi:two-component system chemotaxis response regulator CheY